MRKSLNLVVIVSFYWLFARGLAACDTPVHRYAMYNWAPTPYYVFYLYHGKVDSKDEPVNKLLEDLVEVEDNTQTNLEFVALDLDTSADVDYLPEELQKIAEAKGNSPFHAVVNPIGAVLYTGRMGQDQAKALIDSPLRKRIAESLNLHDGVLLFLECSDPAENKKAAAEIEKAIKLASQGGIEVDDDSEPLSVPPTTWKVGYIPVSRQAAGEDWLVRMLLSIDRLTEEEKKLPMVFPLYGRGRSLVPFLGEGILAEGLLDSVFFINGPCSCQVKDQNPGIDLLTSWDWEETALKIAERTGTETGNEHLLGEDMYLEIAIGEVPAGETEDDIDPGPDINLGPEETLPESTPVAQEPAPTNTAEADKEIQKESFVDSLSTTLLAVFAAGFLALAALGLMLIRRTRGGG